MEASRRAVVGGVAIGVALAAVATAWLLHPEDASLPRASGEVPAPRRVSSTPPAGTVRRPAPVVAAPLPQPKSPPARPTPWPAEGQGLRGRLELPPVFRASEVILHLLPELPPGKDVAVSPTVQKGTYVAVLESQDFAFWVPDLPPGRYRLAARPRGNGTLREAGWVDVPSTPKETLIPIPSPPRSELLVMRAVDPQGDRLPMAHVSAWYEEEGKILARSVNTSAPDDAGAVTVMFDWPPPRDGGHPSFDLARGRFVACANFGHRGTAAGTCAATGESSIVLSVADPGSLAVIVRDLPEKPLLERLACYLQMKETGVCISPPDRRLLQSRGMLEFWQVQPGKYDFVIRSGTTEESWELLRVPVTVGGMNQGLRAAMPPLHALVVRNAPSGIALEHLDAERWSVGIQNRAPDGAMYLRMLPTGRYRATFAKTSVEFTLPGDGEIDMGR